MAEILNLTAELAQATANGFNEAVKFNTWVVYAIYFTCVAICVIAILWFYFYTDNKKTRFLRMITEHEAQILKGNVKNHTYTRDGHTWLIDKTQPIILRTWWGKQPFYILHDKTCIPFKFNPKSKEIDMSSEDLKNFTDHDNFKTMLRLATKNKGEMLIYLIGGSAIGLLIGFIVRSFIKM